MYPSCSCNEYRWSVMCSKQNARANAHFGGKLIGCHPRNMATVYIIDFFVIILNRSGFREMLD